MEDNSLYLIDDKGEEIRMEIILTFDDPETGKQYVVFNEPGNEEDVFAMIFDLEGNLFPIETDKEWEMVEEVLATFEEENEEE